MEGECRDSYLIQEAITLGENGCLHFCEMVEGCKWFTYHPGKNILNNISSVAHAISTFLTHAFSISNRNIPNCIVLYFLLGYEKQACFDLAGPENACIFHK